MPPFVTPKVPVTPVVKGNPVQLVKVPLEGVPKTGVVSVGLVRVLLVNVSVPVKVAKVLETAGTFKLKVDAVFGPTKLT